MSDREFRDRLEALEILTTQLVRTLLRSGVLSTADADQLRDTLTEICIGDPGVAFAAERLGRGIDPHPTSATAEEAGNELMADIRYSRRLYGKRDENG